MAAPTPTKSPPRSMSSTGTSRPTWSSSGGP